LMALKWLKYQRRRTQSVTSAYSLHQKVNSAGSVCGHAIVSRRCGRCSISTYPQPIIF